MSPRFQPGNVEHNLQLVERVRTVADGLGVTVARLAIAWVAAQGEDIIPVIGARRRDQLAESLGAASVVLDDATLVRLDELFPPHAVGGDRYPAHSMAALDSERG